nr:lysoplasmalogenase family protein [Dickeya dadantii]
MAAAADAADSVGVAAGAAVVPAGSERLTVTALVLVTAFMAWVAGEHYFALGNESNFSLLLGTLLLFAGHAIWLVNHFRVNFRAHQALVAICYFGGHFLIVRSLYV